MTSGSTFRRNLARGALALALGAWSPLGTCAADEPAPPAKPTSPGKPARGQSRAVAKPSTALDDALLKDLDNELLEGVQDPPAKRVATDDPARSAADDEGKPGDDKAGDDKAGDDKADNEPAGEDLGAGPEDPLMRIGQQMRAVERRIEAQQAEGKTRSLQGRIVDDLDELIKQLEKQCQGQGSSSASKPGGGQSASRGQVNQPKAGAGNPGGAPSDKPARDSTERLGKNETRQADMEKMQGLMKDIWGQLPAHAREQMLQSSPERFLPKYELLIEKYYKRLAEEQKPKP